MLSEASPGKNQLPRCSIRNYAPRTTCHFPRLYNTRNACRVQACAKNPRPKSRRRYFFVTEDALSGVSV
jgi:hypothetical protein